MTIKSLYDDHGIDAPPRYQQEKLHTIHCRRCGVAVETTTSNRKYCGDAVLNRGCAYAARSARKKRKKLLRKVANLTVKM